MENFFVALYYW